MYKHEGLLGGMCETITQPAFVKASPYYYCRFARCFAINVPVQTAL